MMPSRRTALLAAAILAIAAALGAYVLIATGPGRNGPAATATGIADIGGPLTLTGTDGRTVTEADLRASQGEGGTGALVVEDTVPGGPGEGILRVGDVLVSVTVAEEDGDDPAADGEPNESSKRRRTTSLVERAEPPPTTDFVALESILDANVGGTLVCRVERGGERVESSAEPFERVEGVAYGNLIVDVDVFVFVRVRTRRQSKRQFRDGVPRDAPIERRRDDAVREARRNLRAAPSTRRLERRARRHRATTRGGSSGGSSVGRSGGRSVG